MKRIVSCAFGAALLSGFVSEAPAQKPAYQLFRENGRKVKYEKMVDAAAGADVILFGEIHNNPISHWLQLELTSDLHERAGEELVLGAEMFEADNQLIIDEYLAGLISESKFEEEARLWDNYPTDYKPLVELAEQNGLRVIATNIPRRYANSVFRQGAGVLDRLSEEAMEFMAPLPLVYDTTLQSYASLIGGSGGMPGHGSRNLADAQAVKDAAMSHFILSNREPGEVFIHFNGAYHSDFKESIYWFLQQQEPGLQIVTISTVEQDRVEELEEDSRGRADFIIAVPSTMTKTY